MSLPHNEPQSPAWLAVFSLAMGVFGLLTAEYLPASLLTPMALDLGVSEALAGQAVTVTAVVALFSGLLVPIMTQGLNRRTVLLTFTALMIASNLLVALSSNLIVLLIMRVFLGIALGGFWSMAAAVAMRLVPTSLLPRALSIIFSGIAVGTVVAVPLGSYMGGIFGWRSAFYTAAAIGTVTLLVQIATLPSMAPGRPARLRTVLDVTLRPGIAIGMLGCILAHTGHFALFTYIRPFIETTTGIGSDGLALLLLGFGAANFAGTLFAGRLMERSMRITLALLPAVVGVTALALVFFPASIFGHSLLVMMWGLAFGGVPVAWSAWVANSVPDQAESAGGMVVASVQGSIALGAAAGGVVFSSVGITGVFAAGGIVMLAAAALIMLRVRMPKQIGSAAVHI
ncbi:putative MFS family arabinose efflux permease [Rhizobium sp. BIGb0125]|jgi:predicted MFS family arabinose efflux permease|uniref:MFS transporter n=1 Tax=Rhizobium sp. BIGb0125 TaxID=2940618 RepID=UPI002169B570|nr:MFS transporter [Rhizobium sp. BIGb0125]MCS4244096.1 putative MFS family arabinose efflux permease [Rhizobium sp. BIGb0125]